MLADGAWRPLSHGFQSPEALTAGASQKGSIAGWAGKALSNQGRGPWSLWGSSQKRSDSGESDVGLRDHGSQADSVGGGLTQLQEAGGACAWGQPCSGHSHYL